MKSTSAGSEHPAEQYIDDVIAGRIVAGRWARAMCERHRRDLAAAHERGLHFDPAAGQHVIDFYRFLRHNKGEWSGQVFELEPWQQAILWIVFGWMREDGHRRFRTAYLEVCRKNGKTQMAAGVGLYLLDADGEPGAEIYTAATKRDQARIAHAEATRMVKAAPLLRRRMRVVKDNINVPQTAAKFEPLGRDSDSLDGLNVHGVIADEVHAWRGRDMWDVLETATGARRQPLMLAITTAGYDRTTLCYELHDYTQKVLAQVVDDDTHFGVIYAIDEGDDWQDETCWAKANPNLGVSVKLDDLQRKAAKAREMPSALNAFLRLHLNVWTQAESRWMNPDAWRACALPVDVEGLRGRTCFGGLDLSSTTDISAFVLVFPPAGPDEPYMVLPRFWIPGESMRRRSHDDGVPYDAWVRSGWMKTTPGDVIDYDFIVAEIDELAQAYDIGEIAFDRWGATKMIQELQSRGMEVVQFGQGFASMSAPMKELERLVLSRRIAHGGNVPLAWMIDNVVAEEDAAGNCKPSKAKSTERIDGVVAMIMALDRATRHDPDAAASVYDERGIRSL
jgi:phage terminase large subunit-like protein